MQAAKQMRPLFLQSLLKDAIVRLGHDLAQQTMLPALQSPDPFLQDLEFSRNGQLVEDHHRFEQPIPVVQIGGISGPGRVGPEPGRWLLSDD